MKKPTIRYLYPAAYLPFGVILGGKGDETNAESLIPDRQFLLINVLFKIMLSLLVVGAGIHLRIQCSLDLCNLG